MLPLPEWDVGTEKVMINIERYGNTTNGTIPLCLWEWESKLKKGDNVDSSCFWRWIYLGLRLLKMGLLIFIIK